MTARPQRRFPAFSIRTLLIVMTLLCAYAACWWPTKTQGVADVRKLMGRSPFNPDPVAIAPLVVSRDEATGVFYTSNTSNTGGAPGTEGVTLAEAYYLWFFGCAVKLPYARTLPRREMTIDASEYVTSGPSI